MGKLQPATTMRLALLATFAAAIILVSAAAPRSDDLEALWQQVPEAEVLTQTTREVEPLPQSQQQSLSQVRSAAHAKARAKARAKWSRLPYFFDPKKSAKENANKRLWKGRKFAYYHDQKLDHSEKWNKQAERRDNEVRNKSQEKASRQDLQRDVEKEIKEAKGGEEEGQEEGQEGPCQARSQAFRCDEEDG